MPAEADRRTSVDLGNVSFDPETWKVFKKQDHATNDGFQLQFTFKCSSAQLSSQAGTGVTWETCKSNLLSLCQQSASQNFVLQIKFF